MIIDRIENISTYRELPVLRSVTDYILTHDLSALPEGRTDIDGDRLYVMIQKYETKDAAEGRLEVHDKYIDLQLVLSGEEIIGYAPRSLMPAPKEVRADSDISFFDADFAPMLLTEGMFGVYFPGDCHAPCITGSRKKQVKKAVFKILAKG